MGDRCYMEITCRSQDKEVFEDIGFILGEDDDGLTALGLIRMIDEQANYAHSGDMPSDIPWYGYSGNGDTYCPSEYACDGNEFAEAPNDMDGNLYVTVDLDGEINTVDLELVHKFLEVRHKVRVIFGLDKEDK